MTRLVPDDKGSSRQEVGLESKFQDQVTRPPALAVQAARMAQATQVTHGGGPGDPLRRPRRPTEAGQAAKVTQWDGPGSPSDH